MKHYSVTFRPEGACVSVHEGTMLLDAAGHAGIILNAACGGAGTCGKCEVLLLPDRRRVLACQYLITSDLVVEVPARSHLFEERILRHGIDRKIAICPSIHEHLPHLRGVAQVFGVAVDIGTTTVVAKLVDMATGECRATAASSNPQIACGDDVISRIAYAEHVEGLDALNKAIVGCINNLIDRLTADSGVQSDSIYELTAAGNTTMTHILLKYPLAQLGQAPYRAYSTKGVDRKADETGIAINPGGNVHVIDSIAGFVGSDITAAVIAAGMDEVDAMTLHVDIGTNGEIVLGTKGLMFAASCAAGPALGGARISQGGRAASGAIESVSMLEGGVDIHVDVIGGGCARTICGSGLIDAMAVLLDLGIVDSTGRLLARAEVQARLAPAMLDRIVERNGQPAFVLAGSEKDGNAVALTQRDIRETQLAKAAVRAGIVLLQKKLQIRDEDLQQVLLAGAFGNYIRRESAIRMGLLPNVPLDKVHFIGNAAASGASMILLSGECRKLASEIAARVRYVEIAHEPEFQTIFAEAMMFD